jgi:O-antigen ligase
MAVANRVNYSAIAFWCFALSVAWLPIGFGGDRPIPMGLAQVGLAFSCLFLVVDPETRILQIKYFQRLRWALGMLAAVVIWGWLQTRTFMPAILIHPLWKEAGDVLKTPLAGTIALSPEDALSGLSRLVTYIAAGILAYVLGQDVTRARQMVQAIWLTGIVVCAYGLMVQISGSHKLLWMNKWIFEDDLTATFINRNNFALYADMVLVCGMALLGQSWREDVEGRRISQRAAAIREWIVKEAVPQICMLAMVVLCVIMSHSRAGFVLALAGIGSYVFFYQIYLKAWRRAIIVAVLGFIGAIFALLLIEQYAGSRFATLMTDYSSHDRFKVYGWSLQAIKDNPWLGYGLNSFASVYRLYEQDMIVLFERAHSDVLESLVDLGVPFGLLLWGAIVLLVSGLCHGVMHRRRHGMFPVLGLTTSLMALAHAFVDFSLQIPGVVLCWAALMGLGLAQSWRQLDKQPVRTNRLD